MYFTLRFARVTSLGLNMWTVQIYFDNFVEWFLIHSLHFHIVYFHKFSVLSVIIPSVVVQNGFAYSECCLNFIAKFRYFPIYYLQICWNADIWYDLWSNNSSGWILIKVIFCSFFANSFWGKKHEYISPCTLSFLDIWTKYFATGMFQLLAEESLL